MVKCLFYPTSLIPFLQKKMPNSFSSLVIHCAIYHKTDTMIYLPRFLSLIYLRNSLLLDLGALLSVIYFPQFQIYKRTAMFWGLYSPMPVYKNKPI